MTRDAQPCEVLVVGAGPAACTAARLLALWGRDVLIVAKPEGQEPELPEALTPSCQKFFDLMGISAEMDAAGFVRSTGHTVWWGSADRRAEPFAAGARGWQATSGRLGAVLLAASVQAGAQLRRAALSAEEILGWPAAYRLDCTGRAGVLARPHGGRRYEPGHRTVALVGTWRRQDAWPVDDPTHTLLESYADGWAWSVPLDERDRAVAVMVDPKTTALSKGDGAEVVYREEVAKTRHLASIVGGAVLVGGPWGWDASMYSAERTVGESWLLAGDAASFIDPLSSAGVRKAMASGWLAAIAANTALAHPGLREMAFAYHAAREAETYAQFLALTRQHLHDGAPDQDHPFWADRAGAAPTPGAGRDAIQAAFDRVRQAGSLTLRRGPGVCFESRPAVSDREIVLETRLVTADGPQGVRYVNGVDVVTLVELAPSHRQVPDLFDEYVRKTGAASLPDFLTALSTAVARGWLDGV